MKSHPQKEEFIEFFLSVDFRVIHHPVLSSCSPDVIFYTVSCFNLLVVLLRNLAYSCVCDVCNSIIIILAGLSE